MIEFTVEVILYTGAIIKINLIDTLPLPNYDLKSF